MCYICKQYLVFPDNGGETVKISGDAPENRREEAVELE
jgi:hypothetical protein